MQPTLLIFISKVVFYFLKMKYKGKVADYIKRLSLLLSFVLILFFLVSCGPDGENANSQSEVSGVIASESGQSISSGSESSSDVKSSTELTDQQEQEAKNKMLDIINELKE